MANLAFTWKEQGHGTEALNLMQDCIQLQSKILGLHHPYTISCSAMLIDWQTEKLGIEAPATNGSI
jgi:hypothetical protein